MALLLSCSWGHAAAVERMLRSTSLFLWPMKPVSQPFGKLLGMILIWLKTGVALRGACGVHRAAQAGGAAHAGGPGPAGPGLQAQRWLP